MTHSCVSKADYTRCSVWELGHLLSVLFFKAFLKVFLKLILKVFWVILDNNAMALCSDTMQVLRLVEDHCAEGWSLSEAILNAIFVFKLF